MDDDLLNSIGLGTTDPITGTSYDLDSTTGSTFLDTGSTASTPAPAAAASAATSGGLWNSLSSFGSSLLQFGQQSLPVATQVNNLVNAAQGKTAQNNTASATGTLAATASNPIVWIIVIGGLVLAFLFVKKD
ncbi:MAG: hypothetical protein WBN22_01045 [Verrucomicrobiia bacterium]